MMNARGFEDLSSPYIMSEDQGLLHGRDTTGRRRQMMDLFKVTWVPPSQLVLAWKLRAVLVTHITQGIQVTLPLTLGAYMVRDFLQVDTTPLPDTGTSPGSAVGKLVGLLGGTFNASQLVTAFLLGLASDHIGRKPIMILGNVACGISIFFFGLSSTYAHAVGWRLFGGLFNGIFGAEKAIIAEALPAHQHSQAFSYFGLVWGLGTLIGPVIAGALVYPCQGGGGGGLFQESTLCTSTSVFLDNPYFLPCIVAAILSVIALLLTVLSLEESLPKFSPFKKNKSMEMSSTSYGADDDGSQSGTQQPFSSSALVPRETPKSTHALNFVVPWWKQTLVVQALVGYGLIAYGFIQLDELGPLFASAPQKEGGLGFTPRQLTPSLALSGAALMLWTVTGFPYLTNAYGIMKTLRLGLWQMVPVAIMIPFSSWRGGSFPQLMMILALSAKNVAGTNAFVSCLVLVNSVAPKDALGAVNGVGQTIASLVRAVGPICGGWAWDISLQLFNAHRLHQYLPFLLAAAVGILADVVVYRKMSV